jgi:hypothetical protein
MENNFKDDLKELIVNSNLNQNQKLLWELFLKISNPDEDEAVFEAANESAGNIDLLTVHLRDKIWDMKENNEEIWHKLTHDEEKYAEIL